MNLRSDRNGISLVDLVVGMALLVIVLLGAFLSLKALTQGRGGVSMNARVNNKLRTIAEQMRYDGGTDTYYTWDQNPNHDWTSSFDPSIQVNSVVSGEDSGTRSRKVVLSAAWNDISGHQQTRTMTFYVNRVHAASPGTDVFVRVVADPSFGGGGVKDVRVWAQGQSGMIPPLGQQTDSQGYAKISNVLIGSNIKVHIDGMEARAFFNNEASYVATDVSQHVWAKDLFLAQTSLSTANHELDDPNAVKMIPPAQIWGTVTDLSISGSPTNAPAGLQVYAYPRGAPDINISAISMALSTNTIADGSYRILKLVPGSYQVLSLGDATHTAQVNPGDYATTGNGDIIRVNPNDSRRINFRTTRKGSLTGNVVKITFDGTNFTTNGNAPSSVKLTFTRNNTAGYHDNLLMPPAAPFNFYYTAAWQYFFSTTLAQTQTDTVGGGSYTDPNLTPMFIHQDTNTYSADGQCNFVTVKPASTRMPSDVTPIRVISVTNTFPAQPSDVRFLLVSNGYGTITAPSGTNPALFADAEVKVAQTTNKTIYLADRTLGRVSGPIVIGPVGSEVAFTSSTNNTRIWVNFAGTDNGFGGIQFANNDANQAYLGYYQVGPNLPSTNFNTGSSPWTYDTYYKSTMTNNLPLTLGSDTMRVYFDCGDTVSVSRTFNGGVMGYMKTLDASNVERFLVIPGADVNTTMRIYGYEYQPNASNPSLPGTRGNYVFTQDVPIVGGVLGSGGGGFTQSLTSQNRWAGNTDAFTLKPGEYSGNWKQDAKMRVSQTQYASFTSSFSLTFPTDPSDAGYYSIGDNKRFMTNKVFGAQPFGAVYTYNGSSYVQNSWDFPWNTQMLAVLRRINVHVSGNVYGTIPPASTNTSIQGATVYLKDHDGNWWSTTTDSAGHYDFAAPRYITPNIGWNIALQVGDISVGTVSYAHTAWATRMLYDPNGGVLDVQQDFTLAGTIITSGGGGPGDQGGN